MTRRFLTIIAAALVQACASTPPPGEPQPEAVVAAPPTAPVAARPAEPVPPPVPPPAPAVVLETAKLPPFDGERREIKEPLRGIKQIDGAAGPQDVWQRVRQGFAIPDLNNDLVRKHMAYYTARPDYLQRIFDRSRLYLYHIVGEIERRGLPTELALLPMVESAFNPMAYSRAHASGLWQFIPGTGKRFELEQSWWYDARRDIVDSTDAALDYLTKLYKMHGDWQLALASYNWGENAVSRAVAKNRKARKPTDYSHLKMPKETRQYVPKLQALKNIIANPAKYGITLDPIPNEPYFTVLTEPLAVDVALAARLAEMPVEDFIALNPGLSRPFIRSTEGTRIILPSDKVGIFHNNLAKQEPGSLVSWETYHPEKNESLAKIADKFGLSIAELRRVNGIDAHSSRVPQTMVVPTEAEAAAVSAKLPIMYAPPVGEVRNVHRVRSGDTLSGIAKRYHVRVADLKRWNPGVGLLHINQKIYIRRG
ncbi:MAG: transglycosylase SLT domain-containing protein [Burkholderiales bacterium]